MFEEWSSAGTCAGREAAIFAEFCNLEYARAPAVTSPRPGAPNGRLSATECLDCARNIVFCADPVNSPIGLALSRDGFFCPYASGKCTIGATSESRGFMVNKTLLDHWKFVAKRDYRISSEVDLSQFTASELTIIKKYGNWMQALENRTLRPITRAQIQFLRACGGTEKPVTEFAVAWMKLKRPGRDEHSAVRSQRPLSSQATSQRTWTVCPVCGGRRETSRACHRCNGTGWLDDSSYRVERRRTERPAELHASNRG